MEKMVDNASSISANNFVKVNHQVFNNVKKINDYNLLKISTGDLSLPKGIHTFVSDDFLNISWSEENGIYMGNDDDLL